MMMLSAADDFAPRRPLPRDRVYHFNVIYNHARCSLSATEDSLKALRWTQGAVERLQLEGLVNNYYHDRDCPPGLSFFQELDRVIAGSEVTVVLLTPGFLRDCWPRYWSVPAFRALFASPQGHHASPSTSPPLTGSSESWLSPSPPPPPPFSSGAADLSASSLLHSVLSSSLENEVVSAYWSKSSDDCLPDGRERALEFSASLFASAYYPENCEELVHPSVSAPEGRSSSAPDRESSSVSVSSSLPFLPGSKTSCHGFEARGTDRKGARAGGAAVVVVVALGVEEGEVPGDVKGREVLFFGEDRGRNVAQWSRLRALLLAAAPPAVCPAPSRTMNGTIADPRQLAMPSSAYSPKSFISASTWQDPDSVQKEETLNRTERYSSRSRKHPLLDSTGSLDTTVHGPPSPKRLGRPSQRTGLSRDEDSNLSRWIPRPRQSHLSPVSSLLPARSPSSSSLPITHRSWAPTRSLSSPVWPANRRNWIPAERDESIVRRSGVPGEERTGIQGEKQDKPKTPVSPKGNSVSDGQTSVSQQKGTLREKGSQKNEVSASNDPELSLSFDPASSTSKPRNQHHANNTSERNVPCGQQQNFKTEESFSDIQEIPSKLPREVRTKLSGETPSKISSKVSRKETEVYSAVDGVQKSQSTSAVNRVEKEHSMTELSSNKHRPQQAFNDQNTTKQADKTITIPSQHDEKRSVVLGRLEQAGIRREVRNDSSKTTVSLKKRAVSIGGTSVSRTRADGHSHLVQKHPSTEENFPSKDSSVKQPQAPKSYTQKTAMNRNFVGNVTDVGCVADNVTAPVYDSAVIKQYTSVTVERATQLHPKTSDECSNVPTTKRSVLTRNNVSDQSISPFTVKHFHDDATTTTNKQSPQIENDRSVRNKIMPHRSDLEAATSVDSGGKSEGKADVPGVCLQETMSATHKEEWSYAASESTSNNDHSSEARDNYFPTLPTGHCFWPKNQSAKFVSADRERNNSSLTETTADLLPTSTAITTTSFHETAVTDSYASMVASPDLISRNATQAVGDLSGTASLKNETKIQRFRQETETALHESQSETPSAENKNEKQSPGDQTEKLSYEYRAEKQLTENKPDVEISKNQAEPEISQSSSETQQHESLVEVEIPENAAETYRLQRHIETQGNEAQNQPMPNPKENDAQPHGPQTETISIEKCIRTQLPALEDSTLQPGNVTESLGYENLAEIPPHKNPVQILPHENPEETLSLDNSIPNPSRENPGDTLLHENVEGILPNRNIDGTLSGVSIDKILPHGNLTETQPPGNTDETFTQENSDEKLIPANPNETLPHKSENQIESQLLDDQNEMQISKSQTETKMSETQTGKLVLEKQVQNRVSENQSGNQMYKSRTGDKISENQTGKPLSENQLANQVSESPTENKMSERRTENWLAENQMSESQIDYQLSQNQIENQMSQSQTEYQTSESQNENQMSKSHIENQFESRIENQIQSQIENQISETLTESQMFESQIEYQMPQSQTENQMTQSQIENQMLQSEIEHQMTQSQIENQTSEGQTEKQISESRSENQMSERQTENQVFQSQIENQKSVRRTENRMSEDQAENQVSETLTENEAAKRQNESQMSENQIKNQMSAGQIESQMFEFQIDEQMLGDQTENQMFESQTENEMAEREIDNHIFERQTDSQMSDRQIESQRSERRTENRVSENRTENQISETLTENHMSEDQIENQVPESQIENKMSESQTVNQMSKSQNQNQMSESQIENQISESQIENQMCGSQTETQIVLNNTKTHPLVNGNEIISSKEVSKVVNQTELLLENPTEPNFLESQRKMPCTEDQSDVQSTDHQTANDFLTQGENQSVSGQLNHAQTESLVDYKFSTETANSEIQVLGQQSENNDPEAAGHTTDLISTSAFPVCDKDIVMKGNEQQIESPWSEHDAVPTVKDNTDFNCVGAEVHADQNISLNEECLTQSLENVSVQVSDVLPRTRPDASDHSSDTELEKTYLAESKPVLISTSLQGDPTKENENFSLEQHSWKHISQMGNGDEDLQHGSTTTADYDKTSDMTCSLDVQTSIVNTAQRNVNSPVTQIDKQEKSKGYVSSIEDDRTLTDYLSSSFGTSDEGTLSFGADLSSAGNDSGFLSGGPFSFGDESLRSSTPRTRAKDGHQESDDDKVTRQYLSGKCPPAMSLHSGETMFLEKQNHSMAMAANASSELERDKGTNLIKNEGSCSRSGAEVAFSDAERTPKSCMSTDDQIGASNDSLQFEEPPETRRVVSARKVVHFRDGELSVSSQSSTETVCASTQMEKSGSRQEVELCRFTGQAARAVRIPQAEGAAAALGHLNELARDRTVDDRRSLTRRLLPSLFRIVCHALSRPENPYF